MKLRSSILLVTFFATTVFAQQLPVYTHAFYKPLMFNPAFAGESNSLNAMLVSRAQWIDFRNAPQDNIFLLDGKLPKEKMAMGISLQSDRRGISRKTGGEVYYAYRLKLNEDAGLAFGLSAGVIDHSMIYSEASIEDPTDPMLIGNSQRETSITFNAGLKFHFKGLRFGIAVPQLSGGSPEFQDNVTGTSYYALSRHYNSLLSYKFNLNKDKGMTLEPMGILYFHPNTPLYYEGHLTFEWKNKFWLGASYKSAHAVSANVGVCLGEKFGVGYSYDFMIGKIAGYGGMSHEIMLTCKFGERAAKEANNDVAKNNELVDSLKTELEISNNKANGSQAQVAERDKEIARLKSENESLKKEPDAASSSQAAENEKEIARLKAENEKLKQNSGTAGTVGANTTNSNVGANNTNNTNTTTNTNSTGGGTEPKVLSGPVKDYTNLGTNVPASKGFYVVIGSFVLRDLAEEDMKRAKEMGYSNGKILFSNSKQFHYVAAQKCATREEAIEVLKKLRSNGRPDTWILSIQD